VLARVGGPRPRAEFAAQGEAACAAHRELVVLPVELLKRLLLLAHNLRWWGRRTQDPRRWPSQDHAQRSGPRAKYAEGKRGDARSSGQRRRRGAPRGETPTSACPGSRASPRSSWLQAVSGLAEEAGVQRQAVPSFSGRVFCRLPLLLKLPLIVLQNETTARGCVMSDEDCDGLLRARARQRG
jgi:hypothetical protein